MGTSAAVGWWRSVEGLLVTLLAHTLDLYSNKYSEDPSECRSRRAAMECGSTGTSCLWVGAFSVQ
jgi:hypothetical protein